MKRKIIAIFMIMMCLFGSVAIYATSAGTSTQADLTSDSTVNLVKLKDKELKTLEDYKDSDTEYIKMPISKVELDDIMVKYLSEK